MNPRQIGLFTVFAEHRVEYAVVGGVAVNAYGYVRATQDLDIFIRPTEENAARAHAALLSLGVPLQGIDSRDLLADDENLRFGPHHDSIDILSAIGAMPFDRVWRNRVEAIVEGIAVPFNSKEDLIENKRQVGRLRDLSDIEELERIPNDIPAEPRPL